MASVRPTHPSAAPRFDVADGTMLLVVVIWATNSVMVKWAIGDIDPVAFALSRFALVVALLFPWLWLTRADLRVSRPDWLPLFVSGLAGFSVYNLLFTVGLAHTSAGTTIPIPITPRPVNSWGRRRNDCACRSTIDTECPCWSSVVAIRAPTRPQPTMTTFIDQSILSRSGATP